MTAPSLLGMEWTSWRHFARSIFFHSSRITSFRDWMLDGEWCLTCLFRIPHRCSIGFRSGDILGHWITFTLFFFRNPTVALDVCLGSLSCWKSARRPRARSDGSIFSFSKKKARMSFICHIHNYTEYNEEWNVFSAFNPSKCTHLEQWAADCAAPGEQSWTSCRSRDSNPQPWVTSGFKSNALSIRPTTARRSIEQYICEFMMPSMKCSSPTPAALMQPHIRTLPPPCFTVACIFFVFLTFATPHSFEAISSKNIYLGLIEYRV